MTYVVLCFQVSQSFIYSSRFFFFQTVSCMPILQYAEALIVRIF